MKKISRKNPFQALLGGFLREEKEGGGGWGKGGGGGGGEGQIRAQISDLSSLKVKFKRESAHDERRGGRMKELRLWSS